MGSNFYESFTKRYPVSKTLQFELKPVGRTRDTIDRNHILEMDMQLAEDYKKVKGLLDDLHRQIIGEALEGASLSVNLLEELFALSCDRNSSVDRITEIQSILRKEVSDALMRHKEFKLLFGADVIKEVLPARVTKEEDLYAVGKFSKMAGMFNNYHVIRKFIYTAGEESGTVAHRVVNENLPKFMENIKIYDMLCEKGMYFSGIADTLKAHLGGISLAQLFSPQGFNSVLTQNGIDTYNQVLGGVSTESGLVQGLNVCINLWNQKHPGERKLPLFTPLYKQIMSDSKTASFKIDAFEKDEEVVDALKESFTELVEKVLEQTENASYRELFQNIDTFDTTGIFINAQDIAKLSQQMLGRWRGLDDFFSKKYDADYSGKRKSDTEKYEEEKRTALKKVHDRSLTEIQEVMDKYMNEKMRLCGWIKTQAMEKEADARYKAAAMFTAIKKHSEKTPIRQHKALVISIKEYLDAVKEMQWFLKLFEGSKYQTDRDMTFYSSHNMLSDSFRPFNTLYNKVRNYVTQKPFSTEKIALNFESATLLDGWSASKESTNLGMILRKEGNYYLGIAEKNSTALFKELDEIEDTDFYEKMEYRLLPGPNKMLPKVCFSKKGMEYFNPSEEILRIYKEGTFKKGSAFSLEDCHKLIDFYKEAIERYDAWAPFGFTFSPTEQYEDISGFFNEVSEQGYKMDFKRVSGAAVSRMVEEGRLYLFQIYGKDFAECSKGNLDLQTIYFKMLFDERNLADYVYKLNGASRVFYRKASIDIARTPIHKANEPVANKNPLNEKESSLFAYDIIKNRRYTKEKFILQMSVAMNFRSPERYNLNADVEDAIRRTDDLHILGINRGERNLLYVTVINSKGEIVEKEQYSLNTISSSYKCSDGTMRQMITDYHELLDRREKERDAEQESWQQVSAIKDIKTGYLSHAVHAITCLALKYNAIIVMEDLNSDFIKGRKKIDKAIYQEFEGALLKKLNYLVTDKSRGQNDVHKPGGALNAYQLTNKFESFNMVGWHSGIVFYVSPWNISHMDPTTGFVNVLKPYYTNMKQAQDFFSKFDAIRYRKDIDCFEFSFDSSNFVSKTVGGKTNWEVYTCGKRLERFKNPEKNDMPDTRDYYPTDEMKFLLEKNGIDYMNGTSIKEELLKVNEAAFYKELMHILQMTLQMYNFTEGIGTGTEEYFQSCVLNSTGEFYNSRIASNSLPKSPDAIAAYHLAKKGLLLAKRIKNTPSGEKVSLAVKNKEWLDFVQTEM